MKRTNITSVVFVVSALALCAAHTAVAETGQKDISRGRDLPVKKAAVQRDLPGRGVNRTAVAASKQRDLPGRGINKTAAVQQRDLPGRGSNNTTPAQRDLPAKTAARTDVPVSVPVASAAAAPHETPAGLVTGGILLAQADIADTSDTASDHSPSAPANNPSDTGTGESEKVTVPLATPPAADESKKPAEYNAFIDLTSKPPAPDTTIEGEEIGNDALGNDTVKVKMKPPQKVQQKTAEQIKPKTTIDEFAGPAAQDAAGKNADKTADPKKKNDKPVAELKSTLEKDEGFFDSFLRKYQAKGARPAEIEVRPERTGFERYYEQGLGFKVTDFLSASARVELFEEPIPVESLMLNLFQTAWYTKPWPETDVHMADKWSKSDARNAVRHAYTRSYAYTTILKLHPKLPLVRYTYDRRDLLNIYDPYINGFKLLMQETHEVFLEYGVPYKVPLLGNIVMNPGYQRIRFHARGNPYGSEYRNKGLFHFLFKHSDNYQTFFGYEYFSGKAMNTPWIMKPNQQHWKLEERMWFPKEKLSIIPGWYFTHEHWRPDPAVFWMHETFVELNKDFTDKWRATHRTDLRWNQLEHEPNLSIDWEDDIYAPPRIKAQSLKDQLKVSYEIIKDVDVTAGINWSTGLGYTYFDNIGGTWEIELFKPGLIRVRFGYFHNIYYRLQTHAEGWQFRFFAFQ